MVEYTGVISHSNSIRIVPGTRQVYYVTPSGLFKPYNHRVLFDKKNKICTKCMTFSCWNQGGWVLSILFMKAYQFIRFILTWYCWYCSSHESQVLPKPCFGCDQEIPASFLYHLLLKKLRGKKSISWNMQRHNLVFSVFICEKSLSLFRLAVTSQSLPMEWLLF